MSISRISRVVAQLSSIDDTRPDAELLTAYQRNRDEQAFVTLILRHTPGIRAACSNWLTSASDLDDATQATFLVFLKRADSIRNGSAIGPWLYRTAGFVARKLKQQLRRTLPLPEPLVERFSFDALPEERIVENEIARLPEPYRQAIQLHYLAGLTAAVMAERLGCARSTVLTRLARGRQILQRKLIAAGQSPAILALPLALSLAVPPDWARSFAHNAIDLMTGSTTVRTALFTRSVTLFDGVIKTMFWKKMQMLAAFVMIATGLVGFAIGQWASADGPLKKAVADPTAPKTPSTPVANLKPADDVAVVGSVRREAVIRMPVGTFMKEFEVPPYGSGRIVWTYEGDRVHGQISLSAMGAEVECTTEAEISMASTGTIYGVLTNFKIVSVKLPPEMKTGLQGIDINKAWPLVEPIVNDVMTDLPFSYTFRMNGNNLTLNHFRILLSGPNPLGKLGGLTAGHNEPAFAALAYFQAVGTAMEGTYLQTDDEKETAKKRSILPRTTIPMNKKNP